MTLTDWPLISTTIDFTVSLVQIGPGPSYVSAKSIIVAQGPYTVTNTCYTEPNFGFTLKLDMVTSTVPTYVTLDNKNVSV